MSVSLAYLAQMTVTETLGNNTDSSAALKRVVTHDLFNTTATLNGATTPPATIVAAWKQLLTAGAATIDLTAMVGTNGATINGTGLKVQALKVKALAANANAITVATGASNGYGLAGAATSVTLAAGQEFMFYGNELTPDIAAGAKTIDLSGTGTQGVEIIIVCG